MYIHRVKIRNFRSLTDIEFHLKTYTAFVGLNDSGKSNFLRALNLFFNGQTDLGKELNFSSDFSQQAKIIARKARQIEIEIEFSPPSNYKDKGNVIWRKHYRNDSWTPYFDEISRSNGEIFSSGSKLEYWVKNIAFEYIPAIRGNDFFNILKRRLYTTLAATVAPKLSTASGTFLSNLRAEVKQIESESDRLLQLKTEFTLPKDLGKLFEILDFHSTDLHTNTSLHYRGDGIQGRHIPLILKFLADQRKINISKGKPSQETIWGYEEPENNLELMKQTETAEEFSAYSEAIQILVTTHSPAFYSEAKQNGLVYFTSRIKGKTEISSNLEPERLNENIGLLPFIEPYLKNAKLERDELIKSINALDQLALIQDKPALYVEGSTDKKIIDAVLNINMLPNQIRNFEVTAKDGMDGGVNWAVGCCVARAAITDLRHKTAVLFDDDKAGDEGAAKLKLHLNAIGHEGKIKFFKIAKDNANDVIREIKSSGLKIPFAIEELCGEAAWLHAEKQGWLEERGNDVIVANSHLLSADKSWATLIQEKTSNPHIHLLFKYKLSANRKGNFARYFVNQLNDGLEIPGSLAILTKSIKDYF